MIRSRGGCYNCRRRKKRCNQQRPWCSACRARGLQCTGYSKQLRWIEGTVNPSPAVNTAVAFVPGALSRASVPQSGLSSVSPSIVTVQGPAPSLTPELFRKFLDSGLMRLYKTTGTCWIQPFFAEMSMQSRSISLLSAAIQTYFDGGGADLPVPSMELVDLGVKAFRAELTAYHRKLHPPTACAGLLLCILHFLQGRPTSPFLKMLAELYNLKTGIPSLVPGSQYDPAVRHVLEFIGVMDLPCLVLGRVCPSMSIWREFRKAQDSWNNGRAKGIELISGMPMALLGIFADIPYLDTEKTVERFWTWPGEIGEYLQCHL
ncbi:hypothetical protein NW765_017624 [Fusarium oxysporum]|nr:hypothetical protein NW765_017624 [Fusarium oxysporum]KAJ4261721.1 hypothetical protein NW764_016217 [Fusarium oxysporum]